MGLYNAEELHKKELGSARNEGRAEGRAEGEASKAQEIAINMLNDNASIDIISKYTGLTVNEIKKLEKSLK